LIAVDWFIPLEIGFHSLLFLFFLTNLSSPPTHISTSISRRKKNIARHASVVPASPTSLNVDIKVQVGEGEPIESALRRFKREVNKSGHLMDLRHKRYFENSQDRKKRKIVQARFRVRMERMNARRMKQQRT
jgi:small subunit ribosomal protein S21